jgi:hypothetical protein
MRGHGVMAFYRSIYASNPNTTARADFYSPGRSTTRQVRVSDGPRTRRSDPLAEGPEGMDDRFARDC